MIDLYNYVWRHKWRVWLVVFAFCLIVNGLVHLAFGRPDWVFALASAFGWASGVLVAARFKRGKSN